MMTQMMVISSQIILGMPRILKNTDEIKLVSRKFSKLAQKEFLQKISENNSIKYIKYCDLCKKMLNDDEDILSYFCGHNLHLMCVNYFRAKEEDFFSAELVFEQINDADLCPVYWKLNKAIKINNLFFILY